MLDPITFYSRLFSTALEAIAVTEWLAQMMTASHEVVARRTAMMGDAARSPLDGNYAELSRMVPEKVDAFGKAAASIAGDWWTVQTAFVAQAQRIGALALKGRAPTLAELAELSASNMTFALRTVERAGSMSARSLAPIHASATGNARRLRRGATSSKRP